MLWNQEETRYSPRFRWSSVSESASLQSRGPICRGLCTLQAMYNDGSITRQTILCHDGDIIAFTLKEEEKKLMSLVSHVYTHRVPHIANRTCTHSEESYCLVKLTTPVRDFTLAISWQPCELSVITLGHSFSTNGAWNSERGGWVCKELVQTREV